ncbi:MAG TPA: acetoin dehydrogenase dihydrolipoyllysine-residue acetyltransferase subunit [Geminicoccaceae bacterium]|nr:acetoin dehydrogenase dihydrolipoyllysine-residue acetyltransferase subunit [Geminicoccaceae bacterium]
MSDAIKPIVMPKWGLAMQEGMVAKWLVEEGTEISGGDEILDIETSKIANVYESPVAGPLRRRLVGEGETVPVGALLAVVADSSVSDAELDAFVARFQEAFAVHAAEAGAAAPEPETIEAGGRRFRYLALGEGGGPPIVFIHGFGGDLNNWQFNQEALAEGHATYAVDLPGHGGSSKDLGSGDVHVGALAGAVVDFLDAKDVGRAHLVGHSLGGAVALDLALNHADRVASATLVCSAGLGPEINMAYIDGFMQAKRRKQLEPVLAMLVADPGMVSREMIEDVLKFKRLDGVEAALNRIIDDNFAGGRQALDLTSRLGELTLPVQVIWGRHDQIIPASQAAGLPANVPVHVFDDAGHMVHMEKAVEVNELLKRFVAS